MKKIFMPVIFTLCVFLIGGCTVTTKSGKNFDMSMVPKIQKGVTTKDEILAMFGPPYSKSQSASGEQWMYLYGEFRQGLFDGYTRIFGTQSDTPNRSLFITFKGDIVQDYSTNETGKF